MDDEEDARIETDEEQYAGRLADEAVTALEQLLDDCPEDHQPVFVRRIRKWLVAQYDG